ncbi:MAG: HEPN domain-containing protein [Actinobacteria bacterium]|nr:HEPN domain-containing protein [Actinomycetota bacterium]MCL5445253.1 HEPN domain-containing protein [Actinomycetota bacterium]
MPVVYEVTSDHKALYDKKTLKEWLSTAIDDLVAALDPVQVYLFGSLARDEDGPKSDLDLLVVFDQIRDDQIMPLMAEAQVSITAPVPCDVLVTDLARYQFNEQRLWHIVHHIAKTGVLVYAREPRIPKELYMSPRRPDEVRDAENFLERVRKDLAGADFFVNNEDTDNACFHAQQAAEKALKALLIIEGIEPSWTHNLVELAEQLPGHYVEFFDKAGLASLTPWSVTGRYPEDIPDIANKPTDYLVSVARDTVSAVERLVNDSRAQRGKAVD